MKIEKLNENKIRIILNVNDLIEKNIDLHTFLSNSAESQDIFLSMLDEAEKQIGFVTDNYKIMIEALAISEGGFILTITRIVPDSDKVKSPSKRRLRIKRKVSSLDFKNLVYSFSSFDVFCDFCKDLNKSNPHSILYIESFSKQIALYFYNDHYFLVLSNVDSIPEIGLSKKFCSTIVEFANFASSSKLFENKLKEYGNIIFETNAISNCLKYFY